MTKDENKSECLNDEGVRGHVLSFGFRHSFVIDHLSFTQKPSQDWLQFFDRCWRPELAVRDQR